MTEQPPTVDRGVVVPRVPTDDMLMAARGLIMAREMQVPNRGYSLGKVASSGYYGDRWGHILSDEERAIEAPLTKAHLAQLIYRAMLSAAPAQSPAALDGAVGLLRRLVGEVESFDRAPDNAHVWIGGWSTYSGQRDPSLIHVGEIRAFLANLEPSHDQKREG